LGEAQIAAGVDPALVSVVGTHEDVAVLVAREASADDLVVVFGMHEPSIVEHYRQAFLAAARGGTGAARA
jgi:hypothetical protein